MPKGRNFLAILGWFLIQSAFSETGIAKTSAESSAKGDEKLAVELRQALHSYQNLNSLEVTFSEKKTLKSIKTTLESTGKLRVTRNPRKIIWEIMKPAPLRVILTEGEMQIITSPGSKNEEIQTFQQGAGSPSQDMESQKVLSAWLSLDATVLSQEYTMKKQAEQTYQFEPRKRSPFTGITLKLSKAGHLESLDLNETSGDRMQFLFGTPQMKLGKSQEK